MANEKRVSSFVTYCSSIFRSKNDIINNLHLYEVLCRILSFER